MTAMAIDDGLPNGPLPVLREDVRLLEGPREADGSPTWTLHDPIRHRFFRVGHAGFEFLSRWHLGSVRTVLAAVAAETTVKADAADLAALIRFLAGSGLLRADSPAAVGQLLEQAAAARLSWPRWLLHHYLFIRIPLVRPDAFLSGTLPLARRILNPACFRLVLALGAVGLILVLRQWDSFLHTFQHFFSFEGAIAFAVTLSLVKVAHELGHAYVAKSYGCRVPTMGVALLVLLPVLYTDVSDSWRLTSRRQRLAIAVAGVATELGLALVATLLWSFLPDGPLRSAAFLVATTTWVSTLAINLSPFMRFDGYYLLSDWLSVSNLQERSFALARWQLRRWIFALDEPEPETFPAATRRILLVYAWATWSYRAVVFFGIALLVYHMFFKLLGIFLFIVEVGWFLARPVTNELKEWWKRRQTIRWSPNLALSLLLLAVPPVLLAVPWQTRAALPAVERAADYATLFAPVPAQIVDMAVVPGRAVKAGDLLFRLEAPELGQQLKLVRLRLTAVTIRIQRQASNAEDLDSLPALQEQMATLLSDEAGLKARQDNLIVRAPFDGIVTDLAPELGRGLWVKPDQPLGRVVNRDRAAFRGYLAAADLDRVKLGATGRFLPEDPARPSTGVVVTGIERVNAAILDIPMLASTQGGPVAVQPVGQGASQGALIPIAPVYRVALVPAEPTPAPEQVIPGIALVEAGAVSPFRRIWRATVGVLIRESGF
ncbi:MAG: HlyD family efflux transporter periplasmic adaptor subunit [Rhodospirillaceae bacterium]